MKPIPIPKITLKLTLNFKTDSDPKLDPDLKLDFETKMSFDPEADFERLLSLPQVRIPKMERENEEQFPIIKDDPLEDLLLKEPTLFNWL